MKTMTKYQGGCLCGQVTFEITGDFKLFQYCHCSRCQKVSGSAFASNLYAKIEQITWLSGQGAITRYEVSDAKYYATQFCSVCGSPLPAPVKVGETLLVPASSVNHLDGIKPKQSIHWAGRSAWYTSPEGLPCFDALPKR